MKTKLTAGGRAFAVWEPRGMRGTMEWCSCVHRAYRETQKVAGVVAARRDELASSPLLTPAGRTAEVQRAVLQKAIPELRYAVGAIAKAQARGDKLRAEMVGKPLDNDPVSYLRRQEYRALLKQMSPSEKAATLMGPAADPMFVQAAAEMPAAFTGISADLHSKLQEQIHATRYPEQSQELAEIDEALEALASVSRAAALDLQAVSGISPRTLALLADADPKDVESAANGDASSVVEFAHGLASRKLRSAITARLAGVEDGETTA